MEILDKKNVCVFCREENELEVSYPMCPEPYADSEEGAIWLCTSCYQKYAKTSEEEMYTFCDYKGKTYYGILV